MKTLQILMPMGGLGSRFSSHSFDLPKPLIPVDNVPMFKKALSSLDQIDCPKEYIFVFRKEHEKKFNFSTKIGKYIPQAKTKIISELTRGALETSYLAKEYIKPGNPLLILDCDLYFNSHSFNRFLEKSVNENVVPKGALITFPSNSPKYSYVVVEAEHAIKTAEKVVISDRAIAGAYFFTKAETFFYFAEKLLKQKLNEKQNEYYLSYIFNEIISEKGSVKVFHTDQYHSFGTPEELQAYERS